MDALVFQMKEVTGHHSAIHTSKCVSVFHLYNHSFGHHIAHHIPSALSHLFHHRFHLRVVLHHRLELRVLHLLLKLFHFRLCLRIVHFLLSLSHLCFQFRICDFHFHGTLDRTFKILRPRLCCHKSEQCHP